MRACACACVCVCAYVCLCLCVCVCFGVCAETGTNTHRRTYGQRRAYTHVCPHARASTLTRKHARRSLGDVGGGEELRRP